MTPALLPLLCDPISKAPLELGDAVVDTDGNIISGNLCSLDGRRYPIVDGVPRFVVPEAQRSVTSFGDEWNHFDFTEFKTNWLTHTVGNTFGEPSHFTGKVIVDAGGGSGAQSRWFAEYGAAHVILLELSHSVDGVIRTNVGKLPNVDVVQCSIDQPPLRDRSISGIVYCHNVIQHTHSVEATAAALFALVGHGGEFVFNCYPRNDQGMARWVRFHLVYMPLRAVLSRAPFTVILAYARMMALLRLVPGLGLLLEKSGVCVQGDVPAIDGESVMTRLRRRFLNTALNTFDGYGSHHYQHHKGDDEIRALVSALQPDSSKVLNTERYFTRPMPIGLALRVLR